MRKFRLELKFQTTNTFLVDIITDKTKEEIDDIYGYEYFNSYLDHAVDFIKNNNDKIESIDHYDEEVFGEIEEVYHHGEF